MAGPDLFVWVPISLALNVFFFFLLNKGSGFESPKIDLLVSWSHGK